MSRRTSGRAAVAYERRYLAAAQAGDWPLCKTLAEQMQGLGGDSAEVMYALAYALEHLGDLVEARKCYDTVLRIKKQHVKARARLRALAGR